MYRVLLNSLSGTGSIPQLAYHSTRKWMMRFVQIDHIKDLRVFLLMILSFPFLL